MIYFISLCQQLVLSTGNTKYIHFLLNLNYNCIVFNKFDLYKCLIVCHKNTSKLNQYTDLMSVVKTVPSMGVIYKK